MCNTDYFYISFRIRGFRKMKSCTRDIVIRLTYRPFCVRHINIGTYPKRQFVDNAPISVCYVTTAACKRQDYI